MKFSKILGAALVGGLIYGAYRYGLNEGKKASTDTKGKQPIQGEDTPSEKPEIDCINEIIDSIRRKPNKNNKDRDTIELLQLKLKQLKK